MSRSRLVLILSLCFIAVSASARERTITRLAWLEGRWEMSRPGLVIQEQWMPALGNTMLCTGRVVSGDSLADYEVVVLREHGARFAYEAHPFGQETATFLSTTVTDTLVIFENPTHDFPQRIGYQRVGADSMLAWVEGPSKGKTRRNEFAYRRVTLHR